MDEQALQDSFELFTSQGYSGDINQYKELISTNEEAFNEAYSLFNDSGYNGNPNQFKELVGVNVAGKTNDSASADPNVESSQEDTGSKLEEPLSAWQSIKNTFKKAGERIYDVVEFWGAEEGAGSGLDIATNSFYSLLSSQEAVDEYAKNNPGFMSEGLGSEATIEAIEKYKLEQDESNFATKGLVASAKDGDVGGLIAGGVEALVNAFSSGIYFLGTGGAGVFSEDVAENYITYNKQKAENLGVSLDELIRSGEADNLVPVGLGAVSVGLERFGFGKVLKAAAGKNIIKNISAKLIYNKKARNVANILAAGKTEFTTEILQHATDKINEEFGRTAGTEEDAKFVQATFDAIFSEEGLEAGLQGLIGGGGMAGIGTGYRAMNTIRTTVDGDLIDKNLEDLSKLRVKLNKATDKTEKAGIQKLVDTKISEIADSVRKGKDIYNNLSEGQLKEIENLTDLADVAASQVIELDKKLRAGKIDKAGYDLAYQGFKAEYDGVRQQLIDMNLEQNIKTTEDIAKEKGLDLDVMTTAEVEALMNSDKVSEQNRKTYFDNKSKGSEVSAFAIGNKIVIDKDIARKTGSINAGMHEVLHPVFNKLIGNAEQQGKMVRQFRRAMTSSQRRFVDAQMKKRGYTGKEYNTEYVNVFSDALRKKQINYDKTTFEKIGDAVVSIFKPVGYTNVGFESGKDVYNFIKEFDQSAEQGKLTAKAAEALKDVDLSDAGLQDELQASKTLDETIETDLSNKIAEIKNLAKENEAIAAKYGKDPVKGPKQTRLENEVREGIKPLVEKIVTNRTKALYDPIAADAKRNVTRQEFQDSMRADIEAMVLNEFDATKQDLEKFAVSRAYLRANDLAKRLGIESIEEGGIKKDIDTAKDIIEETTTTTKPKEPSVERGQATFDELDIVDDTLIADIEKDLNKEIRTRVQKGTLSEKISVKKGGDTYLATWLEDYVNKQLFKKLSNKLGAIGERNGETVIPGAYIDFLNDPKTFDIITKALPIKSIKKSYGKLFPIERIGRELTAEGNPIFRIKKIDKKAFLTYFVEGKKTTILERQKQLFREILEPLAKQVVSDYATPENIANLKEAQELAPAESIDVIENIVIDAQLNNLQSKLDRYKGEQAGFDIIQFSRNINQKNTLKALDQLEAKSGISEEKKAAVRIIRSKVDIGKITTVDDLIKSILEVGRAQLSTRAYREFVTNVLSNLQNTLKDPTVINIINQGLNEYGRTYKYQQEIVGFSYATKKLKADVAEANTDKEKATAIRNFLNITSRSIRTLRIEGNTTNEKIFNNVIVPAIGKPLLDKLNFGLLKKDGRTYITENNIKLKGLAQITEIKSDFQSNVKRINSEALLVRDYILKEIKKAKSEGRVDDVISFINLSTADQRGLVRKLSGAGVYMIDTPVGQLVLEHETTALEIASALIAFAKREITEIALIKLLDNAKVNLIPKTLDTKINSKENLSSLNNEKINYEGGIGRYKTEFIKNEIKKLKKSGKLKTAPQFSKTAQPSLTQFSKTVNKAKAMVNRPNAPVKGISIWDFDDTLATTKSNVLYTMPDGTKGKIDATEFALNGDTLAAQGAEFDFSEFSKVMEGAKGPMFEKAIARNKKFGNSNVYILTARPANSKYAIHEFLKGIGLDIKLENIFGLGDSTAIAKAKWVIGKVAEGYNDFYFADDAYKNVKAVQEVLEQADVKSKVHQAKVQFSKNLSKEFNNIIEDVTGIESFKTFSEAKGKVRGQGKGRYKFFIPPSADDFAGLLYKLTGKGKTGEAQQAWFKEALFDPFAKAMREFESYKQNVTRIVNQLKKDIKNVPSGLKKVNETGFTNEVAVRVYLWAKNGYDINGLSETDKKELIAIIEANQDLLDFANQMDSVLDGYPEPQNDWLAGTITTDAINMINTTKRAEFLEAWQNNADAIFTKENFNKLRAAFGDNYVEALQDMLYRMKTGRNRPSGANKLTNSFMNWINDSVGTIMFFNTRSALLQTLSTVNFINWEDNNPIAAAKAFSNQKQFWSDFAMLFNSDFLKQRRSGLKNDINADDIAAAAETSKNKAKAVLSSLLKMGFLPTQIADSFAIALGGASFVRNRTNTYIKQGMEAELAEDRAFLDFQEIAEETQQSSRPDRVSQQQASPLGRIILAFANTPMQYMRLTKKAFLDLKNGRGDAKTNITKIAYYMFIQNVIFSALQSALFAAMFEDDEEAIEEKELRVANSMLDSVLRGVGVYGAAASTLKNVVLEIKAQTKKPRPDFTVAAQRALTLSPPVDSKMRKLMSAARAFSYKTTRQKMEGFGLDNPAYYAVGQIVSATTNVPLDRVVRKASNIRAAMDNDTKYWQKLALLLGYSEWEVGLVEPSKSKSKKQSFGEVTKWKKIDWKKVKWKK
jgi:hypothetical protein